MIPKGFGICNNGGSKKDRRFVIPYYLKRVLNKFCNKESKELRISCAVLSVFFVVLAVITEPAILVGSAVTVVLAAGTGVTVVVTGSTSARDK